MSTDRFGPLPPDHVPDLLTQGLKVVFCGTALGRMSAEKRAYYANPGNLFWRALHDAGLTPERLIPQDYARLLDYGIGLTDLCKAHFGNDNQLPADALDASALRAKIELYQPDVLAFTSKTGASVFLHRPTGRIPLGFQLERVGRTRICVLSSPSGQARVYWNPQVWQELADALSKAR
jgi:TDG/mug DNA glycosylase family protein